jgi:hypothetical protein
MAALPNPSIYEVKQFGSWLLMNQELPGAALLYSHYSNPKTGGQNRQGHFKQSFAAAYRFLCESPEQIPALSASLDTLANVDGKLDIQSNPVCPSWIKHLQAHKNNKGEDWDYSVLRRHLPDSLGGARGDESKRDGGGGSGTLQRMLPLVARYMTGKGMPLP